MANITGWLSPGRAFDAPTGLQPGDPVAVVPGASSTAVLVQKPDGSRWTAEVGEADLFFTETNAAGLYTVLLRDAAADRPAGSFAVNLFSPAESAIRPVESLQIGQTQVETEDEGDVGQRELWPWLLAIAVVLYDGVLKQTPLAPAVMGACRTLNVLLGLSLSPDPWQTEHYVLAGNQ